MKNSKQVGIEKIMLYATPRNIYVKQETYGLYKVAKGGKTSVHEAVKAVDKDGNKGWIINMADRQRKFYADHEVEVFPYRGPLDSVKKLFKPFQRNKKVALETE